MSPRPDFSISHWPRRSWSSFSTWLDLVLDLGEPLERVLLVLVLEHPLGQFSCSSRRWSTSISVGTDWSSIASRLAASSTRSIALSGRKRSVMYRDASLAAVTSAESLILTLWWTSYRSLSPRRMAIVSSTVGSAT